MTIRLLAAYGEYPINAIVTLDAGTETGLVAAKLASTDTAGGTPYVPSVPARQRRPVEAEIDPLTGGIAISAGAETMIAGTNRDLTGVHPRYFCHLWSGGQVAGDPKLYDISGALNHATPGSALNNATLWGNAGYATTIDDANGKLVMPPLNIDYAGGESLLLWWLGKCAAEASSTNLLGDNHGVAGSNGIRVRVVGTSGVLAFTANNGTTTATMSTTALAPFDGALHSFAIFLDADNRKISGWVDGAAQITKATFNGGNLIDLTTSQNLYLGGDDSAGNIAQQTRALVIMRFPAGEAPTYSAVQDAISALRSNPGALLRESAL